MTGRKSGTSQTQSTWRRWSINPVNFALFRVSAAMYMRSALFWDITQRIVAFPYRRFVTPHRSHLQGSRIQAPWTLKMGPIGCPETSVRKYHHKLRNSPEECRSLSVFFIFSSKNYKQIKIVLNGCETWLSRWKKNIDRGWLDVRGKKY